jgi:hypothetical protein
MHKFISKIINHKPRSTFKVYDRGQDHCAYTTEFNEFQFNICPKIVIYRENINQFSACKRFAFLIMVLLLPFWEK